MTTIRKESGKKHVEVADSKYDDIEVATCRNGFQTTIIALDLDMVLMLRDALNEYLDGPHADTTDRIAELEREVARLSVSLAEACECSSRGWLLANELRAKLEAAERDAKRYRWLREHSPVYRDVRAFVEAPQGPCEPQLHEIGGEELDASIDSAMQSQGKTE